MFGNHFYHHRIRKATATFGALFKNIYIIRKDSTDKVISTIKVPLAYAPKEKYLERLRDQPDLDHDQQTALKLPRMSFEIVNLQYDSKRQVPKKNRFSRQSQTDENGKTLFYAGVPYNIYFQLNILTKNHDDALQVVEQIVPYFNPQYSLTIKPFADYPTILEDVPLTLTSTSFSDDFESVMEQRRTIIYTLEFEMQIMFYGPIGDQSIIREVQTNFYLSDQGIADSDVLASRITITPDPIDVSPDSDFGFTEVKTDYIG